jgi:hypothetical protein
VSALRTDVPDGHQANYEESWAPPIPLYGRRLAAPPVDNPVTGGGAGGRKWPLVVAEFAPTPPDLARGSRVHGSVARPPAVGGGVTTGGPRTKEACRAAPNALSRTQVLVAVRDAVAVPDRLTVAWSADDVEGAPTTEPGEELSAEDEKRVFRHYGMDYKSPTTPGSRRLVRR